MKRDHKPTLCKPTLSGVLGLQRQDQLTVVVGLAIATLVIGVYWWTWGLFHDGFVSIGPGPRTNHPTRASIRRPIDPNRAAWPELTLLPGIGQTLAQRIVESRIEQGPYAQVDDLQRVRGIGPATIRRLRPQLSIADPPEDKEP